MQARVCTDPLFPICLRMQFGQNHSAKASDIDTQTQDGIIVNRNAQRGARHAKSNHPFLFPWSKNPSQTDLVEALIGM